jgi:hypothetical protein
MISLLVTEAFMNNVKELKEKNESLMRDLAESCREIVEYSFAYRKLQKSNDVLKKVFVDFLVTKNHMGSEEQANEYIEKLTFESLHPPTQLNLPY